jgi:hypothetical protein
MRGPGEGDVVIDKRELGIVVEVRHVFGSSCGEVVNCNDFIASDQQCIGNVRTDEACAASKKDAHV